MLFVGCKDQHKNNASNQSEPASAHIVTKSLISKDRLLSESRCLTAMEKAEYTVYVDSLRYRLPTRKTLAVNLETKFDKALIFDLLQTTEFYSYKLMPLIGDLNSKRDPAIILSTTDAKFLSQVELNYRALIRNPDLAKLFTNLTQKDQIKCTECAITYLAVYSSLAQAYNLDTSSKKIQIQTGLYIDPKIPECANGIGHMWLVIDGQIHDAAAEPATVRSKTDSNKYLPIVGAQINIDAVAKTLRSEPLLFVQWPGE